MHAVTVLSPHRDDAAFSLYICLSKWVGASYQVTVVNFFTESAYGPRAIPSPACSISEIRRREDRRALAGINRRIRVESAGLLDAPLRLGISLGEVCSPKAFSYDDSNNLRALCSIIRDYTRTSLVLVPLGLGNHIDHVSVRNAATNILPGYKLAFYEDLPYAIWTSEALLRDRVTECERRTRDALKPAVVLGGRAIWRKRRTVSCYQSQISPDDAAGIALFGARYGGGERIWIPRYGRGWATLLNEHA